MKKIKISLIFSVIIYSSIIAQSTRGLVNDGVDSYDKSKFSDAEVNFKKAAEKDPKSFTSKFNLGDATYKQGRFKEAVDDFKNSYPLAQTDLEKAEIFHNIGNSLLKEKKLKESIGAYREALKLNPNDMDTKYNLSYALKQMQNQQNQNKNNKNDQNKDKNKDQQNKDQNKDKQDQNKQDQNKDKQDQKNQDQQQKDQKQNQQQQQQEPKDQISKDQAQRILDALKNNEAELQRKMREQKSKKSNVEKDW